MAQTTSMAKFSVTLDSKIFLSKPGLLEVPWGSEAEIFVLLSSRDSEGRFLPFGTFD
jgi:hypothetical protein